ncbi:hypothetical protein [Nitrogeniibacter aestuarii]|uniref:hypothetical protein n=1 Tax=Nitrogeniibacter aestuarii TaxID=2815343 RepID=UPI001D127056|nr:hypothetical protein [Nitrogeniibacter aestuarii]
MSSSAFFIIAAILNFLAGLAHYACVVVGARGFELLGAGEPLVSMARQGHWYPAFIATAIGSVLCAWGVYALAGARLIGPLPWQKWVLMAATAIYLLRAVAFPLLKPAFPDNSDLFWWVSSGLCLVIGVCLLLGLLLD